MEERQIQFLLPSSQMKEALGIPAQFEAVIYSDDSSVSNYNLDRAHFTNRELKMSMKILEPQKILPKTKGLLFSTRIV